MAAALATGVVVQAGCVLVWLALADQSFSLAAMLDGNLSISVLLGPIVSTACGAGAAWRRFQQARALLAVRRHLPWRVVAFLDDAYQRGVLRRIGTEYQFRHARLQEFLAGDAQPVDRTA